ncbi:MAG TPA: glycosyltransferase family 9 protein [Geobacteraceae bacterium]
MAGILKAVYPHIKICFVGNSYVKPLIDCCEHIDLHVDSETVISEPDILKDLGIDIFLNPFPHHQLAVAAHRAGVPIRVGNLRRLKTVRYCNRFVMYSRKRNNRHEIELNLENLAGLGLPVNYDRAEIIRCFGLTRIPPLPPELARLLTSDRFNLIIHPKSSKNGREWPAGHYLDLVRMLPEDRFRVFLTGIESEGAVLRREIPDIFTLPHLVDLCGKLSVQQSLACIFNADGLVASGTGPLHVAAAMGKHVLGIFPPRDRIDPCHWGPIGAKAEFLCLKERCVPGGLRCSEKSSGESCACTEAIKPAQVFERVMTWG